MVIARPITGKHRTIKNRINYVLFTIFLVIPFVRIGGRPLVMLDIPARKFDIFGLTIWPQELYFLHLLLLILGVMLFFFTALYGRIWCGYACPQTIFTDAYNWIGKLVSSRYGKHTMTRGDWGRVWAVWLVLSLFFSFVFVGYFVPMEAMLADIVTGNVFAGPESTMPAFWLLAIGASTAVAFGNMIYYRENLCKYICPYGRFQTALLDQHSPIVSYDVPRGEERRAKKQKMWEHSGDCIDCGMCHVVCPTGIDIREGLQVGCIACGLCVDACTEVLAKWDKATLIDYRTIKQTEDPAANRPYVRPRTAVYGALLAVMVGAFAYLLAVRVPIYAVALRDRAIQNVHIPGAGYQNGYEVHVGNMSHEPLNVNIEVENQGRFEIIAPSTRYELKPDGFEKIRFIVRYPEDANESTAGRLVPIQFKITAADRPGRVKIAESVFTFPRS